MAEGHFCFKCDKFSTAVTTVRVHPDKYEKNFGAAVTFLTQYIDKKAPTSSVKVASINQTTCKVAEDQHYLWHVQRED